MRNASSLQSQKILPLQYYFFRYKQVKKKSRTGAGIFLSYKKNVSIEFSAIVFYVRFFFQRVLQFIITA